MARHGKMLIALAVSLLALTLAAAEHGERCGWQANGKVCPNNKCCSKFGFCGDTPSFCRDGCQSQCDGGRDLDAYGILPGNEQCGSQAGGQVCPNGLCCSQYGFCGDTQPYCDPNTCQSQCGGSLRTTVGKASHYSKYVPSACYGNDISHFPPNRYMAAVNDNLWKNGQACGRHYQIRCQGKGCRNGDHIRIKVIHRCPNGCQGRVFELSEEAFGAIADKKAGEITVEYAPIEKADAIPWAQKKLIAEVGRIHK